MILVDTSVWIEYFWAKERYFGRMSDLFERQEILGLSWVFGELLQGAKNRRKTILILEIWDNIPKIDEEHCFIQAGLESGKRKWIDRGIGLIDSAIITAARSAHASVWTLDKKLKATLTSIERFE